VSQGARTHTYTIHVLGSEGRFQPPLNNPSIQALVNAAAAAATTAASQPPTSTSTAAINVPAVSEERTYLCVRCNPQKAFSGESAFHQHLRAKHLSADSTTAFSTASRSTATSFVSALAQSDEEGAAREKCEVGHEGTPAGLPAGHGHEHGATEECPACGLRVVNVEEHMRAFRPPPHLDLACDCGKIFHSERALKQHRNFCSIISSISAALVEGKTDSRGGCSSSSTIIGKDFDEA
jgi:hypothetical protein